MGRKLSDQVVLVLPLHCAAEHAGWGLGQEGRQIPKAVHTLISVSRDLSTVSSQRRRSSMARIHSMKIEAPITKVKQFVVGLH